MEQYFKQEQTLLSQQDEINMANLSPKSTILKNSSETENISQAKSTLIIEKVHKSKANNIENIYQRKYHFANDYDKQMIREQVLLSQQQQLSSCFKQESSPSEGVLNTVRKSTRIRKKTQKYQSTCSKQKQRLTKNQAQKRTDLGYITRVRMDEKQQRIHLKERVKQQLKTIPQIISNPGDHTLRQMGIKFQIQKGIFLYKFCIDQTICKNCSKKRQASQSIKLQSQQNCCAQCKQGGQYWITYDQILKMKNGDAIRRYYESFL